MHPNQKKKNPNLSSLPPKHQTKSMPRKPKITGLQKGGSKVFLYNQTTLF